MSHNSRVDRKTMDVNDKALWDALAKQHHDAERDSQLFLFLWAHLSRINYDTHPIYR